MSAPKPNRRIALPYRAVFRDRQGSPLKTEDFEGQHQFASIADIKRYAETHWRGRDSSDAPVQIEAFVVDGPLWHQMTFYGCYVRTPHGWRKVSEEEGGRSGRAS